MMINDGANPLAEVALALAMAFFSLMILMLFAMVNAPKSDSPQASPATVDMALDPRDQPHGGNDRQLVIYTNAGFFDEQLNSLDPAGVDPARPVILAVSDQMPISRIIGFQRDYPGLTVEIAELTPDWQARINGMGRETGQ
jgi:hypothetical protein